MVGTKALDSLDAFMWCQEAGGGDIVVEFPVNERGTCDGDKSNEEEDASGKLVDVAKDGWNRHTSAKSAAGEKGYDRDRKTVLNQ